MKLGELEEGVVYIVEDRYKFKTEDGDLLALGRDGKRWYNATDEFSIMALATFNYKAYKESITFTDEEKELARCALKLGIKVIVNEDGNFYCSADDDIWMGDFGSWENNNGLWFGDDELPLLLKSSLVEKVTESEPLYLEDVVK